MTDPLEIAATAFTLLSVILSVKRSLWQFPTGLAGVTLGFFVFWRAELYSSAVLQPIFIAALAYGWWYWLRGDQSRAPPIRSTPVAVVLGACGIALAVAAPGTHTFPLAVARGHRGGFAPRSYDGVGETPGQEAAIPAALWGGERGGPGAGVPDAYQGTHLYLWERVSP